MVDDNLQDFQVRAEDVRSVGKSIFASWPGYAGTLSLVHFARQESVDPSYQQAICKSPKPVSVYFWMI